jgi:hypothetical protein
MIPFFVLTVVALALFTAFVGAVALRALLWLVLLPLRIVLALLFLPLLLLKGLIFLVIGPVIGLIGVILAVVIVGALALPLAPLVAIGFVAWLLLRTPRRPLLVP